MAKNSFLYIRLILAFFFLLPVAQADGENFTVVIDAGHGGKDPGAEGSKIKEKEINLAVALKLGRLIESKESGVRVIYTRKTDKFVELDERANIANRSKADLFISIHTNAVKRGSSVRGAETYTLGLARSDENLEVAMSENSAILLEDNYEQRYEGFDPNSSESYIIFEFMQNKHMEQSINLASEIQKCFRKSGRTDRGVRQAGFLVLRKTGMPSVLVELGYITNRQEEQFMRSSAGQDKLAEALYEAFSTYKRNYDRRQGNFVATNAKVSEKSVPIVKEEAQATAKGTIVYKVQILTSDRELAANAKAFKGFKDVDYYIENGIYKYTYGETTDFDEIKKIRKKVAKTFKDAFIVAFKDGVRVNNK